MNKKIHIISLGCPKNLIDSEVMAAALSKGGYDLTADARAADVILINTCAFIQPAKEEAIDVILRMALLKEEKESVKLVVTGCLPQRYGKELKMPLPEVDAFLGVSEVPHIVARVDKLLQSAKTAAAVTIGKPRFLMNAGCDRILSTPSYSAYLKIAEGCSNCCAYCVIPAIRGMVRSREIDDVVKEAHALAAGGVKELIVTAQDTTSYGRDLKSKPALHELLKQLAAVDGIRWIRVLYAYPSRVEQNLLKTIAAEQKICKYIDMPIQHIDENILAAMNRRGGSSAIRRAIDLAREIVPEVALRTSVIVGFPGETPAAFNRLLSFIKDSRFDHLGAFTYSREDGTKAGALTRQVSEKVKEARRNAVMEEQAVISYEINQSLIGREMEVLIEGKSGIAGYDYVGRLARQAPEIDGVTYIKGMNLTVGSFYPCSIIDCDEYDLYATS